MTTANFRPYVSPPVGVPVDELCGHFRSHDFIRLLLAACTTLVIDTCRSVEATSKLHCGVRLSKFPTVQTVLETGGSLDLQKKVQSMIGSLTMLHDGGGQTVATGCAKAQRAAEGKEPLALIATGRRRG